jgi:hypothetical protein
MIYNPAIVKAFWSDCGIPVPEVEFEFHPIRGWKFDFAWPAGHRCADASVAAATPYLGGLALEVQGAIWTGGRHSRGSGLVKEYEKMNAAAELGWRVMYCTPQEVLTLKLARQIKAALTLNLNKIQQTKRKP